jgi:hypothetical protein
LEASIEGARMEAVILAPDDFMSIGLEMVGFRLVSIGRVEWNGRRI